MKQSIFQTTPVYRSLIQALFVLGLASVATSPSHAAGLGKMKVLSALGAPFKAEIELTNLLPDEEAALAAKVATPDLFKQAGVDYNPALATIRANLLKEGSTTKIALSSNSAVNEPLLEVLIELNWQAGRLVRQYTVLLDPISPTAEAPVAIEQIQPATPQIAAIASPPAQTAPAPVPTPALPASSVAAKAENPKISAPSANRYEVKKGDTLYNIASRMNGEGAQIKSLMALLLKNNPDAFVGNNINLLKSGVVLNTTAPVAASAPKSMASSAAPSKSFSQYKQSAAGKVKALAENKTDSKSITSSVKAPAAVAAAPTAQDQLKVSGSASVGNKNQGVAAKSAEDLLAKERAIAQEKARINELQLNIQKATELKNNALAAATAKPALAPSTPTIPTPPPLAVAATTDASNAALKPITPEAPAVPVTNPVESITAVGAAAVTPAATPAVKPAPTATPAAPEANWYDSIDPLMLGGAGGALVLLGGWFLLRRRQAKEKTQDFSESVFDSKIMPDSLRSTEGGKAIDTFNSVFVSGFSGVTIPMESAEVDPVAEAEVYMQYGRDAHAEDILKDALKQNPNRHAVRLKLMELYANRKNVADLAAQNNMMAELTNSIGPDWELAQQIMLASGSGTDALRNALNSTERPTSIAELIKATGISGSTLPHIHLSDPTMIGDVQSMNQQGLIIPELNQAKSGLAKFDLPINLATTAMKSPDVEIKTIAEEIEFDIQMPAQFNTPNSKLEVKAAESSAGTIAFNSNSEKSTQYSQAAPNSTIEFNVSKFDLNPATVHDKPNADPANTDMQAIETKFSLAQAYMDIGDTEGAKELLQEVIESGHQNLTNQAKALLLKL